MSAADDGSPPFSWCPHCGRRLGPDGFIQEYWSGAARLFHCWCAGCRLSWDISLTERVVSHEPEH